MYKTQFKELTGHRLNFGGEFTPIVSVVILNVTQICRVVATVRTTTIRPNKFLGDVTTHSHNIVVIVVNCKSANGWGSQCSML